MMIVVFSTLVLTIALLGSTLDKILTDAIRYDVGNAISQGKMQFQNSESGRISSIVKSNFR